MAEADSLHIAWEEVSTNPGHFTAQVNDQLFWCCSGGVPLSGNVAASNGVLLRTEEVVYTLRPAANWQIIAQLRSLSEQFDLNSLMSAGSADRVPPEVELAHRLAGEVGIPTEEPLVAHEVFSIFNESAIRVERALMMDRLHNEAEFDLSVPDDPVEVAKSVLELYLDFAELFPVRTLSGVQGAAEDLMQVNSRHTAAFVSGFLERFERHQQRLLGSLSSRERQAAQSLLARLDRYVDQSY